MAINQAQLVSEVFDVLDETFEHHRGIYLDKGTSLLETLRGSITGKPPFPLEASAPRSPRTSRTLPSTWRSWSAMSSPETRVRRIGEKSGGRSGR